MLEPKKSPTLDFVPNLYVVWHHKIVNGVYVIIVSYHDQDTIIALEALSEYELKKPETPETNVIAEFSVPGRSDIVTLTLANKKEKVEGNLQVPFIAAHLNTLISILNS